MRHACTCALACATACTCVLACVLTATCARAHMCQHAHVCAQSWGGTEAGTQSPQALHRAVLRGGGEDFAALGLFLLLPERRQPQHGHCDSCRQTNTLGCFRGLQITAVEVVAFVTSLSKLRLVGDAECSRAGAGSITEQPQRHRAMGKHSSTMCLGGSVLNSCHVCAEGYCSLRSCWGHGDSGCAAQHPAGMSAAGGLGSPSASFIGAGALGSCGDLGACWGVQRCLNTGCSIAGMLEHARMLEDAGMLSCAGMLEHAEIPVCSDAPACKDSCTHRTLSLQCLEAAVSSSAPPLPPTERDQEGTGPGAALSQPRWGGPRNPELRARAGAGRGVLGRERSLCRISARPPFPAPPTVIPGGAGPAGGGAERGGTGSGPAEGAAAFPARGERGSGGCSGVRISRVP